MKTAELRKAFLEYFKTNEHRIVKSSSLVPHDDPTLLFTTAGMVQFKRPLQGQEKSDYVRATSCQKCMRAGGKHDHLRKVLHRTTNHSAHNVCGTIFAQIVLFDEDWQKDNGKGDRSTEGFARFHGDDHKVMSTV